MGDFESQNSEDYIIHIDNFSGPLDLLWDLIKKSKIDIIDITISHITEEYIAYLKQMEKLNVRIASDFILMASELIYYKSRSLIPSSDLSDEYFIAPLPPELVEKLLEFKKYQQISSVLMSEFEKQSDAFERENSPGDFEQHTPEIISDVSLFDLLKAFAAVLESQTAIEQEEIVFDEILVSDRIEHITELLKEDETIEFRSIFTERTKRAEIIATFLAILEMTKLKIILIAQNEIFGSIVITRNFVLEQIS